MYTNIQHACGQDVAKEKDTKHKQRQAYIQTYRHTDINSSYLTDTLIGTGIRKATNTNIAPLCSADVVVGQSEGLNLRLSIGMNLMISFSVCQRCSADRTPSLLHKIQIAMVKRRIQST